MKNYKIIFLMLIGLGWSTFSHSMEYSKYEAFKKTDRTSVDIFVKGLGSGVSWSNAALTREGHKGLYCPPQKIGLNVENYKDIIEKAATKIDDPAAMDIGLLLMVGMMDTFKCPE